MPHSGDRRPTLEGCCRTRDNGPRCHTDTPDGALQAQRRSQPMASLCPTSPAAPSGSRPTHEDKDRQFTFYKEVVTTNQTCQLILSSGSGNTAAAAPGVLAQKDTATNHVKTAASGAADGHAHSDWNTGAQSYGCVTLCLHTRPRHGP